MKKFKAADYNDYNRKIGLYQYAYLHRLLDILYKLNLKINDQRLIMYESDTGNQAEIKGTQYLDIWQRVYLHKKILRELFSVRNNTIIRQLKLF